jgi:hypothetical protein
LVDFAHAHEIDKTVSNEDHAPLSYGSLDGKFLTTTIEIRISTISLSGDIIETPCVGVRVVRQHTNALPLKIKDDFKATFRQIVY